MSYYHGNLELAPGIVQNLSVSIVVDREDRALCSSHCAFLNVSRFRPEGKTGKWSPFGECRIYSHCLRSHRKKIKARLITDRVRWMRAQGCLEDAREDNSAPSKPVK